MLGHRQRYKAEARGGGSQGKQTAVACTQMFPSSTALPPLCPLFSHVVKPFIRDILSLCFFVTLGNFLENHSKKKKNQLTWFSEIQQSQAMCRKNNFLAKRQYCHSAVMQIPCNILILPSFKFFILALVLVYYLLRHLLETFAMTGSSWQHRKKHTKHPASLPLINRDWTKKKIASYKPQVLLLGMHVKGINFINKAWSSWYRTLEQCKLLGTTCPRAAQAWRT